MLAWRLANKASHQTSKAKVTIKHGDEIIGDGPYPKSFTEFVGQEQAKVQLLASMISATKRNAALGHVLLASGYPGIGKTTLAKLIAVKLDAGYAEVGGTATAQDVLPILQAMKDGDVLFIDEIHRMCAFGKRNAEWLLQLLQDGVIALGTGVVECPKITIVAATTDAQKLPKTILDRFLIQPVLESYTPAEGVEIAEVTAIRLGFGDDDLPMPTQRAWLHQIAAASDYNPRVIGRLLATVRDYVLASEDPASKMSEAGYDVALALKWTGLSSDGLDQVARDYLMLLYGYGGMAGAVTLKAALNESAIEHTERLLIQKGFIQVTPKGRELTTLGTERAEALLADIEETA
jgi:Holliday junction DNA helicase RuvB